MGHNPIPPPPKPTYLEVLKRDYVRGGITVEQFEREVGLLLACGMADREVEA